MLQHPAPANSVLGKSECIGECCRESSIGDDELEWNEKLPDVTKWQPRSHKETTLSEALLMSCRAAQDRILREAEVERGFNLDNFDSGPGLEDLVRQELSNLLPRRYSVAAGVVNDKQGRTAGDCDIVVRDRIWAPPIKLGATPTSRRFHFPIESIYCVVELKQTLGFTQLDQAMEKLVIVSRLCRPINQYGHITENQHLEFLDKEGHTLNPLRTVIMGTRLPDGVTFTELACRFGRINSCLNRGEMVNMLCVLDHGVASYEVKTGETTYIDASFMWDRSEDLYLSIETSEPGMVFYRFYVAVAGHLYRSVLNTRNIVEEYGEVNRQFEVREFDGALYNQHKG